MNTDRYAIPLDLCQSNYSVDACTNTSLTRVILYVLSAGSLIMGCSVYLFFRKIPPVLFYLCDSFNLIAVINSLRVYSYGYLTNNIILYNLPDGLWVLSYLFFISTVLLNEARWKLMLWILPIPISSIICECLQYYHYTPGTFDVKDIMAYVIPTILFEIIYYRKK